MQNNPMHWKLGVPWTIYLYAESLSEEADWKKIYSNENTHFLD